MHVSITADSHEPLAGLLGALAKETLPHRAVLMISCVRRPSSGEFVVTADVGGPEPTNQSGRVCQCDGPPLRERIVDAGTRDREGISSRKHR